MAIARAEYDLFARDRTRPAFESAIRNQQRYNRGFRDTARASRRSTRVVNRDLQSSSRLFAIASSRVTGFATALGGIIGGAAGVRALNTLEAINDQANALATTPQIVGGLGNAFAQFNLTANEAARTLSNVARRIQEAREGGAQADIFERLGLNPERLARLNPQRQIEEIFQALSRLSAVERSFVGQRLFEESFVRLGPLVAQGAQGVRDLVDEFNRLAGPIDTAAASAKELAGEFLDVKTAVFGVGVQLVQVSKSLGLTDLLESLQNGLVNIRSGLDDFRNLSIGEALFRGFTTLPSQIRESADAAERLSKALRPRDRDARVIEEVGRIQDFRAQRRAQADAGFVRRNAERVTTEERVNELTDERLDTQLRILQILDRQRETVTARAGVSIGRGEALPGELGPTTPDRLTGQIERLEEERANRELVELTRKLVQIAEEQKEQGVTLN